MTDDIATAKFPDIRNEGELVDTLAKYGIADVHYSFESGYSYIEETNIEFFDSNDNDIFDSEGCDDELEEYLKRWVRKYGKERASMLPWDYDRWRGDNDEGSYYQGTAEDGGGVFFDVAARQVCLIAAVKVKRIDFETVCKKFVADSREEITTKGE